MKGKVKWFHDEKGYGFLAADDGQDVFCHYSDIRMAGRKTLKVNDEVEFEIELAEKGPRAREVVRLSEPQG